jgi:hypothetical protein
MGERQRFAEIAHVEPFPDRQRRARSLSALWECQEVVVVVAVGVGPNVLSVGPVDHADIRAFSVHKCEKRVRAALNRLNNLCARPFPTVATQVRDAFVRIVSRLL